MRWSPRPLSCMACIGVLLAACGDAPSPAPEQPPPEVNVITLSRQDAANVVMLPGRVQAVRTAEVRARVDGVVQQLLYTEGSDVEEGQRLFQIDPRDAQASVDAARAALARAQSAATNAEQDLARYEGLVASGVVSRQQYDAIVAGERTARAEVAASRAQLERAQLNRSYTTVTAPIAGRAGRAQVSVGALVSAAAGTLMTTVESLDPIYVNFSVSSNEVQKARRDIAEGRLVLPALDRVEVSLLLDDGRTYPDKGHLNFLDLSVDRTTGSSSLRAEFPNPRRELLPGQFVRARIEAGQRPDALLVPQRAVTMQANGATVMVVGPDDVVAPRAVTLGPMYGGGWAVLEGLAEGERVIVDGLQMVAPGMKVTAVTP